jgi:hypothetical protein
MKYASDAAGVINLVWIGLRVNDEFGNRLRWNGWMHHMTRGVRMIPMTVISRMKLKLSLSYSVREHHGVRPTRNKQEQESSRDSEPHMGDALASEE